MIFPGRHVEIENRRIFPLKGECFIGFSRKKLPKLDQALFLVQMALEIFLLHTKLHGPVTPTASPPMNRHLYPLILNDDRNNQLPQQSPGAPRRAGVVSAGPVPVSAGPAPPIIPPPARMRRDHHHCVPGCRQLVAVRPRANGVRPRANGMRWHRPTAERIAPLRPRRYGEICNFERECTLLFE